MTGGDRASIFEQNLATYGTPWSAVEYSGDRAHLAEAALVSRFFPPASARVLDLGCGAGRSTVALAERGYSVVGIDLSEPLLAIARRRHPQLDFRAMDARRLAFDDASFDAALFSYNGLDVIYPLAERLACLSEVRRVLKPGGLFVLSTHNAIGTVCCGGWFYARGYLNAGRFLLNQVTNPVAREWYFRYQDGSGDHYLYSAPPSRTLTHLEAAGFEVLITCGEDAVGDRALRDVTMRYQHVHFAACRT